MRSFAPLSDRDLYKRAKADHAVACGGRFISFAEFVAEPRPEREAFANWLRREADDVRRELRADARLGFTA